jgi:predicted RNA binding protein YcfA (HicA-like mRNA interferase family)
MSRSPRVSGSELIRALASGGFQVIRIRGSHHLLRHADGRSTVAPVHSGETIGPGLLHKILRDCQLSVEDLLTFLKAQ